MDNKLMKKVGEIKVGHSFGELALIANKRREQKRAATI